MDVGKGWPAPGGCPGATRDNTIINRIMLRFRPIAPKPMADGSISDSISAAIKTAPVTKRRTKRKYVRVKKSRKCKSETNKEVEKEDLIRFDDGGAVPVPVAICGTTKVISPDMGSSNNSMRFEMNFDKNDILKLNLGLADRSDRGAATSLVRVVESWVVVDGMAETLVDVGGFLGSTDTERMANLEMDTCPGLISDGMCKVQWVNLAYRRMVDPRGGGEEAVREPPAEVVVWLVLKEKIPVLVWPMFACTVRVVYTWRKEKYSRTMPCDVWKMDFGGFAWRLDAKAALTLGR